MENQLKHNYKVGDHVRFTKYAREAYPTLNIDGPFEVVEVYEKTITVRSIIDREKYTNLDVVDLNRLIQPTKNLYEYKG